MSELTIRFDSTEVSDIEVAAVTVAVAALYAGAAVPAGQDADDATLGRGPGTSAPAWRAAALLEATDGRRLGSLASLRDALGRPG